jgi:hypothetical protein
MPVKGIEFSKYIGEKLDNELSQKNVLVRLKFYSKSNIY